MVIVVNSFRKQSSSKQKKKKLKLQVQRVRDYTTYYQALPEHSIEERGILRVSSDLDLAQLPNTPKGAPNNEGILVMRIDTANVNKLPTQQHEKSRATSYKSEHHIAYNGLSFDEGS